MMVVLTIIHTIAIHMANFLPVISAHKNVRTHPEKHPKLYIDTIIPSSAGLGWLNVSRKSTFPTIPENTLQ